MAVTVAPHGKVDYLTHDNAVSLHRPSRTASEYGLSLRMAKISLKSGHFFTVVLDDGLISGPQFHAARYRELVAAADDFQAPAIMAYPGFIRNYVPESSLIGRIIDLSSSTTQYSLADKRLSVTVSEASRMNADAVAVHISLGVAGEASMIADLSHIIEFAHVAGIPVVAAAYARNQDGSPVEDIDKQAHAVRLATELGADIVKAYWPNGLTHVDKLIAAAYPTPVVIAGGSPVDESEALRRMEQAHQAGAAGAFVGRQLLAAKSPGHFLQQMIKVWQVQ